jgi:predicted N-acetyltransferase YhbS
MWVLLPERSGTRCRIRAEFSVAATTADRQADPMNTALPGGLVLRTGTPDDLDQIAELLTTRGEAADALDHRLVIGDADAGWPSCAVVVDGGRVVSTATLLDETLILAGVPIPAGQVELVATDREYEGRGLVRALMGWAHRRSADRGHLAQVMIGIPYFYRQFGYSYALPIPATRKLTGTPPDAPGHAVRRATAGDIPTMAALQDGTQQNQAKPGADLRMPHSAGCWRWLVARTGSEQWLVERDGVPVATGRTTPPEEGVRLAEVAAVDEAAAYALLHHARALGDGEPEVTERPGTVAGDAYAPLLGEAPDGCEMYYARVADPAALLEHLRPVLSARLAAAPEVAHSEGEALVSFFRSHVRFKYRDGVVGPVTTGGTMQAPGAHGGAGVAPDLVAPLLFGPHGMAGLTRSHPDVYPGPNAALMRALFPPVHSDLLTFYLT